VSCSHSPGACTPPAVDTAPVLSPCLHLHEALAVFWASYCQSDLCACAGADSVPAFGSEWYSRNMYVNGSRENKHSIETYGPHFGYKDLIPLFTAHAFNATEWASIYHRAGARYAGPVAEHADGFAMFKCGGGRLAPDCASSSAHALPLILVSRYQPSSPLVFGPHSRPLLLFMQVIHIALQRLRDGCECATSCLKHCKRMTGCGWVAGWRCDHVAQPRRDVVGELASAIRAQGLRVVTTLHHQWLQAWYPTYDSNTDAGDPRFQLTADQGGLYGAKVGNSKCFGGSLQTLKSPPHPAGCEVCVCQPPCSRSPSTIHARGPLHPPDESSSAERSWSPLMSRSRRASTNTSWERCTRWSTSTSPT
jgi:hypothetical protein